jgi:ATP-dependent protease ClpP protease subunit
VVAALGWRAAAEESGVAVAKRNSAARREELRDQVVTLVREAELFHDTGLALATRTIYMGSAEVDADGDESGTDAKMAEKFIKNLHLLESINAGDVTAFMNNVGGCEYSGAAIYDAIKMSPCRVTIIVRGHAMSMGSVILQAAADRVMGPSAKQMIHYGTWGVTDHAINAVERHAREGKWWNEWMERIYLERIRRKHPKFTLRRLKALLRFDTYLTAAESIDLGLADRIG